MRRVAATLILANALCMLVITPAHGLRIKDLCEIQGARGNDLIGIGIVVGLAGTGDNTELAVLAQQRMLERLDIEIDQFDQLNSDNSAIVMVTATLPAFAKEGTRLDVKVDALSDCDSLEGGTLLETHLRAMGGGETVFAVAQGSLSVGGFNADTGGGTSVRMNHVTAGRIPNGAYVEQEAPSTITDGERLMLLLKRPEFVTAHNVEAVLNTQFGQGCASALGAGAIHVRIPPEERPQLVGFIARLQELEVETDTPARVVINERTGTIVVGGQVMVKPCQVAHGNLSIKIATETLVSQPAPLSEGQTVVVPEARVEAIEDIAFLMPVEGTSAGDVAAALNKLKVTPRDMISIFQALREAGALEVDLEVM